MTQALAEAARGFELPSPVLLLYSTRERRFAARETRLVVCPECGADVSPLREFCPKCGTPTDPGLRERRQQLAQGGRSSEELKGNRKKVLIVGAAVLALGTLVTFNDSFHSDDRPTVPRRSEARGPVTIEADQLYQAYRDDPHAAARRFDDREMVVSGEFLRIVPDGYGSLDLRLKTSNPEQQVGVDLAQLAIEDGKKLVPGQKVTVSCQGMGEGHNIVWVRYCAIQPMAEGGSAAPSPAPAAEDGNKA